MLKKHVLGWCFLVSYCVMPGFPQSEWTERSWNAFYDLVLAVCHIVLAILYWYFCHIVLVTQRQTWFSLRRGTMQGMEYMKVRIIRGYSWDWLPMVYVSPIQKIYWSPSTRPLNLMLLQYQLKFQNCIIWVGSGYRSLIMFLEIWRPLNEGYKFSVPSNAQYPTIMGKA